MHPVHGPPRVQQEKEPLLPPKAPWRGAGDAPAAGSRRWAGSCGRPASSLAPACWELRGLPASGTGSHSGPTTHPKAPRWARHLGMLLPTATCGIQDRQRYARSHSQPAKAPSRPSALPPQNSPTLSVLARWIHPIAALALSLSGGACALLWLAPVSRFPQH